MDKELHSQIAYIINEATSMCVSANTLLSDLPFDSLDQAEIECILESKYGFKAEPSHWRALWANPSNRIADLARFVETAINT